MAVTDILSNPKYPDDMVLTVADGITFNVGEIRALPAAERAAVTAQIVKRESTMAQAELAFANKFQEALKAGWITEDGKILPPPQRQQQQPVVPTAAQIRTAAAAEFGIDENDPLLGPVVKLVKQEMASRDEKYTALEAKINALPNQLDSLKNTLTGELGKVTGVVNTSVGRYLNDTYQSDFQKATKDLPAGVKVDYEAAFKYATDHGLKDKDGFYQIADAVDRLTWNDRKKAELDKERADLIAKTTKEIEDKTKLAALTPPQSRNPLHSSAKVADGQFDPFNERTDAKGNKVRVVKSFDEAMAAASMDEDVLKSAMGTASFGTVQ
jgi:hypothetical protein